MKLVRFSALVEYLKTRQCSESAVSTVASQQGGCGFDSQVFLSGLCMCFLCLCGFSPGTPAEFSDVH